MPFVSRRPSLPLRNIRSVFPKIRRRQRAGTQGTIYTKDKGEWVVIEEFNSRGLPTLPQQTLQSTKSIHYDSDKHKDLDLYIQTGMSPEGSLISPYKIYEITRFSMHGWRLHANVFVDLDLDRMYEEQWFQAFLGSMVLVRDPGLPGLISNKYRMKVVAADFRKRSVSFTDNVGNKNEQRSLQAHLRLKETWRSTLLRRKSELFRNVLLTTIGAFIAVMLGKLL